MAAARWHRSVVTRSQGGVRWRRAEGEEVLPANVGTSADMTSLDHIHEPAVLRNLADRWETPQSKQP